MGGECDGRNLGLITHLGQKEGDQCGAKDTVAACHLGILIIDLVGNHDPAGHQQEGDAQYPAQQLGTQQLSHGMADGTGKGVVEDCGDEDPENDRDWVAESGCQNQREQLGFVTHLRQCNYAA